MVFLVGTVSSAPVTNPGATMNYAWLEDGLDMAAWNNDTLTTEISGMTDYGLICIDPLNGCADTAYATVTPTLPPVPVEFVSVQAKLEGGDDVMVGWTTAQELNNEYFLVQRRYEYETSFSTIGRVKGQGTTSEFTDYQYLDNTNLWLSPVSYYRIMQVDYDGTSVASYTVPVSKQSDLEVLVYPNPTRDETIVTTLGDEKIESLQVLDLYGKDITGEISFSEEDGIYTLDVRALRNGTYYVALQTKTQRVTQKVVVAR